MAEASLFEGGIAMDVVSRLLTREEIDALELELARIKAGPSPDFARVQHLRHEIARLERRISARRRVQPEQTIAS
jgi:uncharacterized sporulation protein YeaH/YhbH (DUF444 family)